jgi:hypothetical protein
MPPSRYPRLGRSLRYDVCLYLGLSPVQADTFSRLTAYCSTAVRESPGLKFHCWPTISLLPPAAGHHVRLNYWVRSDSRSWKRSRIRRSASTRPRLRSTPSLTAVRNEYVLNGVTIVFRCHFHRGDLAQIEPTLFSVAGELRDVGSDDPPTHIDLALFDGRRRVPALSLSG